MTFEEFKEAVDKVANEWLGSVNKKTNYDKPTFGEELYKAIKDTVDKCLNDSGDVIVDTEGDDEKNKYVFRPPEFTKKNQEQSS